VIRHPIFVVGMPRSGTTLLSAMLDAHSQIAISPETHFYTRCQPSAVASSARLEETWDRLLQQPGVQDMGVRDADLEEVWREVQAQPAPVPSDLLRALLTTYADRSDAEAWGEKTPDHLAHVPTIFDDFPRAVILAIVRDPRDVCLSLKGLPWNHDSLPESAWKWRGYARRTERYTELFPSRFREVRYERLLDSPETLSRDLLDWLGAPFEEAVLAFHREGGGPVDAGREPWKEKVARPIDSANKEKWRQRMGPAEQWVVQALAGRYLRRKDYTPEPVILDGAFVRDLVAVGARSVHSVLTRIRRRWQTPSREEGDHRPTWIRRQRAVSDSPRGEKG